MAADSDRLVEIEAAAARLAQIEASFAMFSTALISRGDIQFLLNALHSSQQDTKRLDWLSEFDHADRFMVREDAGASERYEYCDYGDGTRYYCATLRDAIDKAIADDPPISPKEPV